MSKFGKCKDCDEDLEASYFEESEYKVAHGIMTYTGRTRIAVDFLFCPICLKNYCVDDSFDGPWQEKIYTL